jgi:predicted nucleotide-binding protein (sugar kinase/HSP70/actin superfamily)
MYLKDKVDALFIPRIVSVEKSAYTCPKFLGLPDMIKALDDMPKIIAPTVNFKLGRTDYYKAVIELGELFTDNRSKIFKAYLGAMLAQRKHEKSALAEFPSKAAGERKVNLQIGLAGHPYNIYDEYTSMHLIKRLKDKGVNLVTAEMTPPKKIKKGTKILPKELFWTYEKEVLGAASHWLQKKLVDGIIYVIAFPCGPDSIIQVLLEGTAKRLGAPFLSLVLDEHSGEAGLVTRIEAFIDQLAERKAIAT